MHLETRPSFECTNRGSHFEFAKKWGGWGGERRFSSSCHLALPARTSSRAAVIFGLRSTLYPVSSLCSLPVSSYPWAQPDVLFPLGETAAKGPIVLLPSDSQQSPRGRPPTPRRFGQFSTDPSNVLLCPLLPELAELPHHHLSYVGTYWIPLLEDVLKEILKQSQIEDADESPPKSGDGIFGSHDRCSCRHPHRRVTGPIGMGSRSGLQCGWLAQYVQKGSSIATSLI